MIQVKIQVEKEETSASSTSSFKPDSFLSLHHFAKFKLLLVVAKNFLRWRFSILVWAGDFEKKWLSSNDGEFETEAPASKTNMVV